ncbi:DNA replication protein [Onygenales sp. PD_40]|nr:DNA replication protein [Onygenales sp. PD_40]KAK2762958.1 DNA replication protein [Emmonsiellopsis sp. PD_33]KAK2775802.1 DNA replication protein [Onygenales sp. PD_12]KAK2792096.1 DNA replication protein [Onygenales sp. PD_10]KAK2804142.1 DNA replication protein [Emmonsiellopsis sp. PD_5]
MAYYDIDDILTDAQVKPGTRIDVPIWLGQMLAVGARTSSDPLVTLDLPPALSEQVMNALKADPRTVDLRSLAPHFYRLGVRMLQLFEEEEMVEVLSNTFKMRAMQISDHAHNSRGAMGDGAEFLRGLDETERQLFRAAHDSAKEMRVWSGETKKK